jgi:preprotein translocase subunit YajC
MKKSIFFVLAISLLSTASLPVSGIAHAEDAPTVVAPGQPATAVPADSTSASGGVGQVAAPAAPMPQQPGLMGMALPFLIMLGIMYFLMIRPQQKRMKEHQSLLSSLKTGDEVITSAGILGTIAGMSEKVVTLEVSKNVQLKVLKSQVNQVVKGQIKDLQPNA